MVMAHPVPFLVAACLRRHQDPQPVGDPRCRSSTCSAPVRRRPRKWCGASTSRSREPSCHGALSARSTEVASVAILPRAAGMVRMASARSEAIVVTAGHSATTRQWLLRCPAASIVRTRFRPNGEYTQDVRSTIAREHTARTACSSASLLAP